MIINIQPADKLLKDKNGLSVHSMFKTLQGEGPFTGVPAVFVRLAGCNLQCPGCDTEYTGERVKYMTNWEIADTVSQMAGTAKLVVITGGEPFRQDVSWVSKILIGSGFTVQIETNGTLPVPDGLPDAVCIVVSPKTDWVQDSVHERAAAFKYVLSHDSVAEDGLPIRTLGNVVNKSVARPKGGKPVYIQPMDAQDEAVNTLNVAAAVKSCLRGGHTLQLQIHKIIGVE